MDRGEAVMPIKRNGGFQWDILLLLMAAAEMEPLLQDQGLGIRGGIILLAEYAKEGELFVERLELAGAIRCTSLRAGIKEIPNNRLGIHVYRQYEKESEIQEFLDAENFTPAVIVYGTLPSFLRGEANLFPLPEALEGDDQDFAEERKAFSNYAHGNAFLMQRTIRHFRTSETFKEVQGKVSLYKALLVTMDCYLEFFRETANSLETEIKKKNLKRKVARLENLADICSETCETLEPVRKAMCRYLDDHPEVLIGKEDELEGGLLEAIQRDEAILWDDDHYFIPETVLRSACAPLLKTVSFPAIKRELHEAEILSCNDGKRMNFTTKKLLTDVYGQSFRARFLKIKREFFQTEVSFGLEERRRS